MRAVVLAPADQRNDLRMLDMLIIHVVARAHSARADQCDSHVASPLQFKAVRRQIGRAVRHRLIDRRQAAAPSGVNSISMLSGQLFPAASSSSKIAGKSICPFPSAGKSHASSRPPLSLM